MNKENLSNYSDLCFEVKTLMNALAPILVLMELAISDGRTAADLNRAITQGRFSRSQGPGTYKLQPALIYNLMKALVEKKLIRRNEDENIYFIEQLGKEFLSLEMERLLVFSNDLKEFIKETKESL